MCIVLATTAHPSYALILINNRDEYLLRPTSRPHWWTSHHHDILSSRDLQRAERGTWLGITKTGNFAVLTNYREEDAHDRDHPIQGTKSRGGIVKAALTAPEEESTQDLVERLLEHDGVKGVGGFSLICGKLRRRRGSSEEMEPLAIISNRSSEAEDVPWIGGKRDEVYGLSNSAYADPITWPKVELGKERLSSVIQHAVATHLGEQGLVDDLFAVLDTNTLPEQNGEAFETYLYQLRKSIFIPSIGQRVPPQALPKADEIAAAEMLSKPLVHGDSDTQSKELDSPNPATLPDVAGVYGTQRQTIVLVDWDGHVKFHERSLFDSKGNPIARGSGDMEFDFQIDRWDG